MTIKVAFLGPKGTFTHQALIQQFGSEPDSVHIYPQDGISDCFKALDSGAVDYAVVPYENSTNGQVVFTYDLLRDWFIPPGHRQKSQLVPSSTKSGSIQPPFRIVAEQFVSVHHNLLTKAKSISEVKTIYSHPQVWTQVSSFLSKKFPLGVQKIDTSSTAKAAEIVHETESDTIACISSKTSASLFNLPTLYENIEDSSKNTTRFLVLGNKELPEPEDLRTIPETSDLLNITSIIFSLPHDKPGALREALYVFHKNEVNMTSINSRPSHSNQWHYVFFVEVIGDLAHDARIKQSISDLGLHCEDVVALGSFKRYWPYLENS